MCEIPVTINLRLVRSLGHCSAVAAQLGGEQAA